MKGFSCSRPKHIAVVMLIQVEHAMSARRLDEVINSKQWDASKIQ